MRRCAVAPLRRCATVNVDFDLPTSSTPPDVAPVSSIAIMFRATCQRLARQIHSTTHKLEPLTIHNNPYRARKVWPPDFSQLSPQQQLRLEKKHKRRVALAGYSPKWDKGVRLVRALSIIGTDAFRELVRD